MTLSSPLMGKYWRVGWFAWMLSEWLPPPASAKKKKKRKRTLTGSELKLSGLLNAEFKFYGLFHHGGMQMLRQSTSWSGFQRSLQNACDLLASASLKSRLLKSVPWVSSSLRRLCVSSVHQPCWSHFVPPDLTALPTPDSAFLLPGPQAQNDFISKTTTWLLMLPSKIFWISSYYLLNQVLISY